MLKTVNERLREGVIYGIVIKYNNKKIFQFTTGK